MVLLQISLNIQKEVWIQNFSEQRVRAPKTPRGRRERSNEKYSPTSHTQSERKSDRYLSCSLRRFLQTPAFLCPFLSNVAVGRDEEVVKKDV